MIISIMVSLLVWKEKVTFIDVIGLLLLCFGVFLCTYRKDKAVHTPQWKYYVVGFLIFAASVGIVFKAFSKACNLEYCDDMMFVAAVFMTFWYFAANFIAGGIRLKDLAIDKKGNVLFFAMLSGILSCLYNRLNVFLSGSMEAIVFFPVFNGGVVFLSTILSVMMLKEKMSARQLSGLVTGMNAIGLIGIL